MNQMSGRAACLRVLRQECGRQVHRSGGSQTAAGREVMISGNIHEKGPEHRAPAPPGEAAITLRCARTRARDPASSAQSVQLGRERQPVLAPSSTSSPVSHSSPRKLVPKSNGI